MTNKEYTILKNTIKPIVKELYLEHNEFKYKLKPLVEELYLEYNHEAYCQWYDTYSSGLIEEAALLEEGLPELAGKAKEWAQNLADVTKAPFTAIGGMLKDSEIFKIASKLGKDNLEKIKKAAQFGKKIIQQIPEIMKSLPGGIKDFSKMSDYEKNDFIQENWDKISDKIQEFLDKNLPSLQSYFVAALLISIAYSAFKNGPSSVFSKTVFHLLPKYLGPALQGNVKWNDVFKDEFDSVLEHLSGNIIEFMLGQIPVFGDAVVTSKLILELLFILFNKDGARDDIAKNWKESIFDPIKKQVDQFKSKIKGFDDKNGVDDFFVGLAAT